MTLPVTPGSELDRMLDLIVDARFGVGPMPDPDSMRALVDPTNEIHMMALGARLFIRRAQHGSVDPESLPPVARRHWYGDTCNERAPSNG